MSTIFSKIIAGELPSYKVYEDEQYIAFLDVRPLVIGHTLIVPKKETDFIFDIENEEYSGLMLVAKKVAKAIKKAIPCKKVGVAVIGLEVPHAHIHLIPMNSVSDMNFSLPKLEPKAEEMEQALKAIKAAL